MASQRIVERRGANHGLHVFLSLITCGIWAITGWPIAAVMGRKTVTRVPVAPQYPQPPAQQYAPPPQPQAYQPPPAGPYGAQPGPYNQPPTPQPPPPQQRPGQTSWGQR